jgi:anion-transporting  ArsA/GET3 family ATPase
VETLKALAAFLLSMRGMYDGFKERAAEVKALLASEESAFVLVTAPTHLVLDEARFFYGVLHQNGMHVEAIVLNRMEPDWQQVAGAGGLSDASLASLFGEAAVAPIRETLEEQHRRARGEAQAVRALLAEIDPEVVRVRVPTLRDDIHDLRGLDRLGRYLFDPEPPLPARVLPPLEEGA